METEVINTLANSSNVVILILLASGPVFGILILFGAYKISTKYLERFVVAVDKLTEQAKLTRELVDNMRKEVDEIRDDVSDVKAITSDNNRRLEIIEKTGLPHHVK